MHITIAYLNQLIFTNKSFWHMCIKHIHILDRLLTFDRLPEVHSVLRQWSCFVWRARASAVDVGASACWRPRIRSHRFHPPPCRWGSSRAAQKWRSFALFLYLYGTVGFACEAVLAITYVVNGKRHGDGIKNSLHRSSVVLPRNFVRKEMA